MNDDLLDELSAAVAPLEPDAVRVLVYIARRLLHGQEQYGPLQIANDERDWRKERAEEIGDLLVYSALGELKAYVTSRGGW